MNILDEIYKYFRNRSAKRASRFLLRERKHESFQKLDVLFQSIERERKLRAKFPDDSQIEPVRYTTRIKTTKGDIYIFPDGHVLDASKKS